MNAPKSARPKFFSALVGNWVGIFGLMLALCSLFAALFLSSSFNLRVGGWFKHPLVVLILLLSCTWDKLGMPVVHRL